MEQSINNFIKGLQMDPHPMVQGNDVLSDALNATFITGTGDELVLQNDMGNRRVDEAFLPPGYIPLGMKEYGGIIYIAAYNPITNRGQVGSFPSPERKIIEDEPDINIDFSFLTFLERGFLFLVELDKIWILYDKNTFHIGDKFTLYNNRIWEQINGRIFGEMYLSNFCNTTESKVVSPKNKFYTLSLGILDLNNLFIDITKSLKRFNGYKLLESPSNKTQLFKTSSNELYNFNQGYFIAPNTTVTEEENEVDKVRTMSGHNLYGFKLISPLCLKLHFNRALSFSYSFSGLKTDTDCTLNIRGTLYYNCPDGAKAEGQCNDIDYYKYYTLSIPIEWFNLYLLNKNGNYIKLFQSTNGGNNDDKTNFANIIYLKELNLYKAVINKNYNFLLENYSIEDKIQYFIGVPFNLTEDTTIEDTYLRGCSYFGELDLNYLNPIHFEVLEWKFKTENNRTTVNYNFEFNVELQYTITIEFVSIDEDKEFTIGNIRDQIGNFVIEGDNYVERGAYKVTIKYSNDKYSGEIPGYWVLSTSLFNDANISNYVHPKIDEMDRWNQLVTIPFLINYMLNSVGAFTSTCINNSYTPMYTMDYYLKGYIKKTFVSGFKELLEVKDISIEDWNKYPLYIEKALKNPNNISDIEVEIKNNENLNVNYKPVSIITENNEHYGTLSNEEYTVDQDINYTNINIEHDKEKLSIKGEVIYNWDFNYDYTAINLTNNRLTNITIFDDNEFSKVKLTPDFYFYYNNGKCYYYCSDKYDGTFTPEEISYFDESTINNIELFEYIDNIKIQNSENNEKSLKSELDRIYDIKKHPILVCRLDNGGSGSEAESKYGYINLEDDLEDDLELTTRSSILLFIRCINPYNNKESYKIISPASKEVLGNDLNKHILTTLNKELEDAHSDWRVENIDDIYVPSSVEIYNEENPTYGYVICKKNGQVQNPEGYYNYGIIVSIENIENSFEINNVKVRDGIDPLEIFNYSASLGNITNSSGLNIDQLQLDIYSDINEIIKLSGYKVNILDNQQNYQIKYKYRVSGNLYLDDSIDENELREISKFDTKLGFATNIFAVFTNNKTKSVKLLPVGGIFDYLYDVNDETTEIKLIPYLSEDKVISNYYYENDYQLEVSTDGNKWLTSKNYEENYEKKINIINRFATVTRRNNGKIMYDENGNPKLIFAL